MKSKKDSSKRKKGSIYSDVEQGHEALAASSVNGLNESPMLWSKRSKSESQPSIDPARQYLTIWACQNRQLNKRSSIELDGKASVTVLLERLCKLYDQSIDETVLFVQCDDSTWSEISAKNDNATLCEVGIEQHNIISLEEKERAITSTDVDVYFTDLNVNSSKKMFLIVKHIRINQEMQIECDENDTVHILKEKVFAQLPPDSDYKLFQLFIDFKLMNNIYDDRTLASLSVTSTSPITVDMRRKLKTTHSNKPAKSNGHCGLRNLGNTCYMNSALQCLSQVTPLTDYFLQHHLDNDGDVAQTYSDFIRNMWGNAKVFAPHRIKTSMSNYAPQFAGFNQEDAHEFMTFLLNQLHIDLKQQQTTSIISQLFHGRVNGVTTCLTCGYSRSTPNLITFIPVSLGTYKKQRRFVVTFEPIHSNTLTLETDASGRVKHLIEKFVNELQSLHEYSKDGLFERIQVLSKRTGEELAIETPLSDILDTDLKFIAHQETLRESHPPKCTNSNSFELTDCIRDFVALEMPETLWFCKSECQQPRHVAKQMKLSILPPILIVQLRRFINENERRQKLHTFINFPLNDLDLSEFVTDHQTTSYYDLIAVVNHIGNSLYRGHYTTYARQLTSPTAWYSFNDEHVSPIEENDIVSQDAYLLVYAKREQEGIAV